MINEVALPLYLANHLPTVGYVALLITPWSMVRIIVYVIKKARMVCSIDIYKQLNASTTAARGNMYRAPYTSTNLPTNGLNAAPNTLPKLAGTDITVLDHPNSCTIGITNKLNKVIEAQ